MNKEKIYLSGPITSLPLEDARRIFESAEEFIFKLGYIAVNPMKNGLTPESTWEEHMKRDLAMLLECDTICMLPNFRESKGAMLELDVAIALGMSPLRYTPAFWYNASLAEKHLNDTIEEPSRTLNNGKQSPAIPYEKIQHRADFLNNFKNGWELYNTNPLFRTITMLMMSGASIYDLFLELIFMVDGRKMPEISIGDFLASNKEQDNETK